MGALEASRPYIGHSSSDAQHQSLARSGCGDRLADTEVTPLARDKLGFLRHGFRAELQRLPERLDPGEQVLSMASVDWWGRLLVATDKRFLVLSKSPFRPLLCHEVPYDRLTSVDTREMGAAFEGRVAVVLVLRFGGKTQAWEVRPQARGAELAKLAAERRGTDLEGPKPG